MLLFLFRVAIFVSLVAVFGLAGRGEEREEVRLCSTFFVAVFGLGVRGWVKGEG